MMRLSILLLFVCYNPAYSFLPRLVNNKVAKTNKLFQLQISSNNNNNSSNNNNNNNSSPNIPTFSSSLIPILPGDTESVIVAKIQQQTILAKGYLDMQRAREQELLQRRTKQQISLIFAIAALIFGVYLRDGLLGKVSEIGKYIDSIRLNKWTYALVGVGLGIWFQLGTEIVKFAKYAIRTLIKKIFHYTFITKWF